MTGDINRCCRCHCPCLISCNELSLESWKLSWSQNRKKVDFEDIRRIPKYYCRNVSRASWNMNQFASAATSLYVKTSEKNGSMPPIVNLSSHYVVRKFSQSSSKIVSKFCQSCVEVVSYLCQIWFTDVLIFFHFCVKVIPKLSRSLYGAQLGASKMTLWKKWYVHPSTQLGGA